MGLPWAFPLSSASVLLRGAGRARAGATSESCQAAAGQPRWCGHSPWAAPRPQLREGNTASRHTGPLRGSWGGGTGPRLAAHPLPSPSSQFARALGLPGPPRGPSALGLCPPRRPNPPQQGAGWNPILGQRQPGCQQAGTPPPSGSSRSGEERETIHTKKQLR